jgi:hypothetical protein
LLVSGDDTSARDGLRQAVELSLKVPDLMLSGSSPTTFTSPSSKAHQKSGLFAPPALPGNEMPRRILPGAQICVQHLDHFHAELDRAPVGDRPGLPTFFHACP